MGEAPDPTQPSELDKVVEEVVSEAVPLFSNCIPSDVLPSRNCTVPVADAGATIAVKVTGRPTAEGFVQVVLEDHV